jgi:simple sugar transport system substrate-binding protein
MYVTKRLATLLAASAATVLVLAGCTGTKNEPNTNASNQAGSSEKIAVITHGGSGDAFWDVVKKGAEQAGKDLGVTVTYQGDGDAAQQANLINAAVADKANGIVVSMANPDALSEPIKKAVAAGIPVITINSGQGQSAQLGALAHVGQDETVAGQGAGSKFKTEGVKHLLCVVHEAANIGLEQRCAGAKVTLGGTVENLQVDINNVAEAQNTIASKLQSDKSIDGVLALNPAVATAAVTAVQSAGSQAKVATFDLSGDVVQAVIDGKILFAIDQQQYVQGYLPVVMLHLYLTNNNTLGGGLPVLTGPGFVTKDNAAKVKALAAAGTR